MRSKYLVLLTIISLTMLIVSCSDTTTRPEVDISEPMSIRPSTGEGSQENPYLIANLGNLYWISRNKSEWDKHFVQTADIDAQPTTDWFEGEGWTAIGYFFDTDNDMPFTGVYDGGNYVISGLYINRPAENFQGLFGRTEEAILKNIGLRDVDITGNNRVGGLVGNNRQGSVVNNSFSSGNVYGNWCVGGLVGGNWSATVYNSYSSADVVSTTDNVGGLIGYNGEAQVANSYSTGLVTGASGDIGGMIGINENSNVINSYWNNETSGQLTSAGGEKRSTDEMTYPYSPDTYHEWDFDLIWSEDADGFNQGYPYLKWQR